MKQQLVNEHLFEQVNEKLADCLNSTYKEEMVKTLKGYATHEDLRQNKREVRELVEEANKVSSTCRHDLNKFSSILERYDQILCEKVNKLYLVDFEEKLREIFVPKSSYTEAF